MSVAQQTSIPQWIAGLATGTASRDRVLADGRRTIRYGEVPALLDSLDSRLRPLGVGAGRPVALECSQSVTGALALLYVLTREIDVVLLPDISESAKESGTPRFVPSFCSHVLTASATRERSAEPYPWSAIEVEENTGFCPDPMVATFEGPDLYLRTSGSTGRPKLARMSHRKWWENARGCVERWGLDGDDRLSVPVPIFHSYGFGAAFLPGLLAGAAMDFGSSGNLLRYLEREERFAPNVAFLTPSLCDMFVTVRKSPRAYRLSITAGDKIKPETVAAFEPRFGPLVNLYGSAEMGAVSSASPSDPPAQRLGTAGYALPGIELDVVAGGEAAESDGGRSGALRCRQSYGLDGYLVLDEESWRFESRSNDEWFETGDLARLRGDGYVELQGRAKLSVKRDGLLVVFADVEAALERVEGVARAVVVAAGESARGSRLVAACVLREGATELRTEEVRQACARFLPRYAVPDEVVLLDALPVLPSGKVDRRTVTDLMLARTPAR